MNYFVAIETYKYINLWRMPGNDRVRYINNKYSNNDNRSDLP